MMHCEDKDVCLERVLVHFGANHVALRFLRLRFACGGGFVPGFGLGHLGRGHEIWGKPGLGFRVPCSPRQGSAGTLVSV